MLFSSCHNFSSILPCFCNYSHNEKFLFKASTGLAFVIRLVFVPMLIEHICDIVNYFIEVIIIVLDLIIYNVRIALGYWLLDLDLG